MRSLYVWFSATVVFLAPTLATAALDIDIRPQVQNQQIVTGGYADSTNQEFPPNIHAFGFAFGDDVQKPYETDDPGLNASEESGLPGGKQLHFDFADASLFGLSGDLTYWNGTGSVQFGTVPNNESLELSFVGQGSATIDGSPGPVLGFDIGTILSDGSFHRHLTADLAGGSGSPTDGVYLLAIQLSVNDPTIKRSLPFFLMYNNGLTDQQDTDAFNYVTSQLVPRLLIGDTNGDGQVDLEDFNNIENHFHLAGNPVLGDTNGDGQVDLEDFNNVQNHFAQHLAAPALSVASVPEPSTMLLTMLGLVSMLVGRRRVGRMR